MSLAAAQTSSPPTTREAYANLPGVRIWYKDTGGDGVPVVLMHAATGSSQVWEHQIPAFTAAGYRVIAYDRLGWGRSVVDSTGPKPGSAANDLQALMDYLHIDRFHLVATAAGGSVSLDYAVSFPQHLRSLVIANGALGGLQDEPYQQLSQRIRSPQLDALPPELRELGPSYRATNPEGARRWVELRTQEPARWTACTPTTDAEPNHVFCARNDESTFAICYRRCGSVRAASTPALCCREDQEFRIGDHTRGRTFGLLGATGDLQPRCPGIYSQALIHREQTSPRKPAPPQYFTSCNWIARPSGSVKYNSGVPSFAPPRFSMRMLM